MKETKAFFKIMGITLVLGLVLTNCRSPITPIPIANSQFTNVPEPAAVTATGNVISGSITAHSTPEAGKYTVHCRKTSGSELPYKIVNVGEDFSFTGLSYEAEYEIWVTASLAGYDDKDSSRVTLSTEENPFGYTPPGVDIVEINGKTVTFNVTHSTPESVLYTVNIYEVDPPCLLDSRDVTVGEDEVFAGLTYDTPYYITVTTDMGETDPVPFKTLKSFSSGLTISGYVSGKNACIVTVVVPSSALTPDYYRGYYEYFGDIFVKEFDIAEHPEDPITLEIGGEGAINMSVATVWVVAVQRGVGEEESNHIINPL